ncbi:hypothetical protein [Streptomyces sp. NPDC017529]|uniref:hypothetical protein n=1 Tax=Streptomyces sp. NPDC017529 TaxID=3365000 RepID=UPI00378BF041
MTAPALYEIETSEDEDGTMHPVGQLWTPGEDAVENGFLAHGDLHGRRAGRPGPRPG